ncbi:hypothetical protein CWI71_08560 [Pseudidiomarina insulisalsae]|uniref:Uncharacterized protein n=2 Tax=Pseudidiomarina insulisalsae TaxID=575789 RepID=A0A432YES8_9GAMM|nr:hypothetical protein CWI71_08560 [Pseudidiomarina insulisalsae]
MRQYLAANIDDYESAYITYWVDKAISNIPVLGAFFGDFLTGTITWTFDDGTTYQIEITGASISNELTPIFDIELIDGSGRDMGYPIPENGGYDLITPTGSMVDSGYYDRAVSASGSGLMQWILNNFEQITVCTGEAGNMTCSTIYVAR